MPIHDWARVPDAIFVDFQFAWITRIRCALNQGALPPEHYALIERAPGRRERIAVRQVHGDWLVALVEIIIPRIKGNGSELREFVLQVASALDQGTHILLVDLLSPTLDAPLGIHGSISQALELPVEPPEETLSLVSYCAGDPLNAYLEPTTVGKSLPDMPLFLSSDQYVSIPLEQTYQQAWTGTPARWRRVLEGEDQS